MSSFLTRRRVLTHGACLAAGAGLGWLLARAPGPNLVGHASAIEDDTPEGRLRKLKIELPVVKSFPGAVLVPAVRVGDLLYLSGNTGPERDGKRVVGKLGKDVTVEQGQAAARDVGLLMLAMVRAELGTLDKVVRVVKALGMVNCTPEFTQQPAVVNGFSKLMVEVFGEKAGKGARSAVGMASLPGGAPVEVECIFQVKG